MRPVEFSTDQILEAGQQLQAEGRNITGFALRKVVGGGSPARLKQVWDEHRAQAPVAAPVELPAELADQLAKAQSQQTEQLASLVVELHATAAKAADRRAAEAVRSAAEAREQAERELADAAATVDDLETQIEGLREDLVQTRHARDAAQSTVQNQAIELAKREERLAAIAAERDRANRDLAVALGSHRQLESEHDKLLERFNATDSVAKTAKQERERADHLAGELAALKAAHAELVATLRPNAKR